MAAATAVGAVIVAALLRLAALTALGARRRGAGWPPAIVSGLCFPVAWVAWYVRDAARLPPERIGRAYSAHHGEGADRR